MVLRGVLLVFTLTWAVAFWRLIDVHGAHWEAGVMLAGAILSAAAVYVAQGGDDA